MTATPPPRRPTMADVAAAAGVSTALVSIVVREAPGASDATRRRVLAVAAELGYRPDTRARVLRSRRSGLIGVVFGSEHTFHADLVQELYAAAEPAGWDVVLSAMTPMRSEARALQTLLGDRCEALVLLGSTSTEDELAVLARDQPVVVLARGITEPTVDSVRSDDAAGVGLAVDHLVDLGHRSLVHVDGAAAPGARDRREGFLAGCRRRRVAGVVLSGGDGESDGAAAATALLASGLPSAIVAFNDQSATGVLDTLRRHGVEVPQEVSVVGYDGSRLAGLAHLDLTTVGQDATAMATRTVALLTARLRGAGAGAHVVIAPRLLVRGSSGPPR